MNSTRTRLFLLAMGLLSTLPAMSASANFGQNVECYGHCESVTLNQVCRTFNRAPIGTTVVSVSCDDSSGPTGVPCGNGKCQRIALNGNSLLSDFCADGNRADATVTCR